MRKKSQGLSLQTIVVAVLVLIVLVVLIFIFSDKIGGVGDSLSSCKDKGGECSSSCKGPTFKTEDCTGNDLCCITLGGSDS